MTGTNIRDMGWYDQIEFPDGQTWHVIEVGQGGPVWLRNGDSDWMEQKAGNKAEVIARLQHDYDRGEL